MAPPTLSQASIRAAFSQLARSYRQSTPTRLVVLDLFLAYTAVVAGLQLAYCFLAGSFPLNSFLSGFFCSVGVFVLTAGLRLQIQSSRGEDASEGGKAGGLGRSEEVAFGEYVFCAILLFVAAVNFMG